MKYKILKPLTLSALIKNSAMTDDELRHFSGWLIANSLSPKHRLTDHPDFPEYAKQSTCFWKFLTEGGYIEEIKSAYDQWVDECPFEWAKRMPRKD